MNSPQPLAAQGGFLTGLRPGERAPYAAHLSQRYANCGPGELFRLALEMADRPIATTSFGPLAAPFLHLLARNAPHVPLVWIDHGFGTPESRDFGLRMAERLRLDLRVYRPRLSPRQVLRQFGGSLPGAEDSEALSRLAQLLKLDPFDDMQRELSPDLWLTGIQRDETSFRKTLDIVTSDARIPFRVAPLFHRDRPWLEDYAARHDLPLWHPYEDPTKPGDGAECGLQLSVPAPAEELSAQA